MVSRSARIFPSFIAVFAITVLLILAGPANAFSVGLGAPTNASPLVGEKISFIGSMDLKDGDAYLPVKTFVLTIEGSSPATCEFTTEGEVVSGCDHLIIQRLSRPSSDYQYGYGYAQDGEVFGYGYGYGYSYSGASNTYEFNVTMQTGFFNVGEYDLQFHTTMAGSTFNSAKQKLKIRAPSVTEEVVVQSTGGGGGLFVNPTTAPTVASIPAAVSNNEINSNTNRPVENLNQPAPSEASTTPDTSGNSITGAAVANLGERIKSNWYYIVILAAIIGGVVYYYVRKRK